jgi:hypothetical protein
MSNDSPKEVATRLALLPWMTPKRFRTLLSLGEPDAVVEVLRDWSTERHAPMIDIPSNIHALLTTRCSKTVARLLGDVWCEALGNSGEIAESLSTMDVHIIGRGEYPPQLSDDQNAPTLLYSRGNLELLSRRRVGRGGGGGGDGSAAFCV